MKTLFGFACALATATLFTASIFVNADTVKDVTTERISRNDSANWLSYGCLLYTSDAADE